ncbi:MAG: acyl-CoA/acyl-ACP dehydrogenase [Acidimicrobiales bacterium]|nr:acyl-CoA/acyl-ACP dehydrogenase [Acidimicrobiales bacterium]
MDFELSEDQEALRDGIRALCEGRFSSEAVRALIDHGGVDRARWRDLAETGVFALTVPEADGGVGLAWADAVIVFEELGRSMVPGPLVATLLAAELVEGAAWGDTVVGLVERPQHGPAFVEHLPVLDTLLVIDADGVWQVDPTGLTAEVAPRPLDPLTPIGTVADLPQGERIGDADLAALLRLRGSVLTSALQLGLAQGATDLAVDYAKERQQFGKPIGSFQAVKHLCADMIGSVEVCRAAVYMAGVCLDVPEVGDATRAASVARLLADETSSHCGKDCVQVHGGMGYTWEVDAHLYLKRAWALALSYGSADDHAEAMAALV